MEVADAEYSVIGGWRGCAELISSPKSGVSSKSSRTLLTMRNLLENDSNLIADRNVLKF